ncbi:MAG: ABC transporter ATP-binding protein [Deltaproteobacteria bacterium]|nr:ABC transporter ATP-binding protein [Deltaproteobacteria bacterium]
MIETQGLVKQFGRVRALNGLTFRVEAGTIAGLLGANGAGKTTTLSILAGRLAPGQGLARVAGLDAAGGALALGSAVGFLPETPPLYAEMRLADYLAFAARLRGVPKQETGPRVEETLAALGLADLAGRRCGGLSHGMRRRAGIAQALVHRPPVLLLDEPMAGLDPAQVVQFRQLIASLRGRHTVLLSTHQLSEAAKLCDKVVLMCKGRAVEDPRLANGSLPARHQGYTLRLTVRGDEPRLRQALAPLVSQTFDLSPHPLLPGALAVQFTAAEDLREEAARRVVEAGLGLLELGAAEEQDLEALFLELTRQEPIS